MSSGSIAGTTGTLNAAGLAALPALKDRFPSTVGTLGYGATVNTGAPFTPWLTSSTGTVLAGVYQHPTATRSPGRFPPNKKTPLGKKGPPFTLEF